MNVRTLIGLCLGAFIAGAFTSFVISLTPWSEFGSIDPEAWLGFWGTLVSSIAAAVVAVFILAIQFRKQDEHHSRTIEVQREEARKAREIQALAELNTILAGGYSDMPPESWIAATDINHQKLMAAVANWKMNWDVDDPQFLNVDEKIDSAAFILENAYKHWGRECWYLDEFNELQEVFKSWTSSVGVFVNSPRSERRNKLVEFANRLEETEVPLVREQGPCKVVVRAC